MSSRWKWRNTRRRSSSSTFWPIRPGPAQEEHAADRLHQHDPAQRRRRSVISVRADPPSTIGGMPWSMPRCTSSGTDSRATFSTTTTTARNATVHAVGPQQRTEQRPRLASPRERLVDRQVVVACSSNRPRHSSSRHLREVLGARWRSSTLDLRGDEAASRSHAASVASRSSWAWPSRLRCSSSSHAQLRSAASSSSSSAARR